VLGIPPRHHTKLTAAAAAVLSQLCALIYYRSFVAQLRIPIDFSGDALQKLQLVMAAVRDGWIFHNSRIGLPAPAQHLDFPRYDSLNYALIKLLAWCTGDAIVAVNAYFLLGYGLVAYTACWVFRQFGLSPAWSLVGAIAYAWFPYHQLRGLGHFTNAAYWLVPLACWFIRTIWYPAPGTPAWTARTWSIWLGFAVILELQNPYYAIFFVTLAVSVALVLTVTRDWRSARRPLIQTGAVVTTVLATFVMEQVPRWVFEARQGKNALAVFRPASGPSEFALSVADLLNPSPDHPIPWLANWTRTAADIRGISGNERVVATLSWLGVAGFVIALAALLRRIKRLDAGDENTRLQQWAGGMIVVALAWCHEGALCTLISESGFGLVRAWNRMSVYIAFATVLAAVSWLAGVTSGWQRPRRTAAVALTLALVLAEQMLAVPRSSAAASRARFNEARQLASDVTRDGRLHRAFIVPYLEYPEAGRVDDIFDYDHFMLTVASERLAISYGGMRGRGSHYFSSATTNLNGAELAPYLREAGFDTLIVDTFSKATSQLEEQIAAALGEPVSRTRRFLAYRIGAPSSEAPAESAWRAYALGTVIDFHDVAARRYLELNFSGFEPEGTWTIGKLAALRFFTPSMPAEVTLDLQGQLFESPHVPQRVRVSFDGHPACTLDRSRSGSGPTLDFSCNVKIPESGRGPLTHEVRFEVEHPVSPAALGQGSDLRLLGLRLTSLRIEPRESPPH
jgi:hypothetical protein